MAVEEEATAAAAEGMAAEAAAEATAAAVVADIVKVGGPQSASVVPVLMRYLLGGNGGLSTINRW